MNKNFIFLGPPNSGKGTQAKELAKKINAQYFGAGDILRQEIEQGTNLGKEFKKYTSAGELVPNNLLNQLFGDKIAAIKEEKIVFDGFPRSMEQVDLLKKGLPGQEFVVININVSDQSLLERMEKRRICEKCGKIFIVENNSTTACDKCGGQLIKREDDNPVVLGKRIDVYKKETQEILDYFRSLNSVIDIDGEDTIEAVGKEIWNKVNGNKS